MTTPRWGTRERPWPISATDLDGWEYYKSAETMTPEEYLRRLNRTDDVSTPLILGQCFHNAVEVALRQARDERAGITLAALHGTHDGHNVEFVFEDARSQTELEVHLDAYDTIEQDVELVFDTPAGWVHLRGKIDGLMGTIVRDLKTTKSFKAEKYQDSWQWRAYLQAMGPIYTAFEYHVFALRYGKPVDEGLAAGRKVTVQVADHHKVPCYRYPRMLEHLQGVCAEFATYVESIGWEPPAKRAMQIF